MKHTRWILALVMMLCLTALGGTACAMSFDEALEIASHSNDYRQFQVFKPVPEERVQEQIKKGLDADYQYADGLLTITITEDTDWQTALFNALSRDELYVGPRIISPTGEAMACKGDMFPGAPENVIVEILSYGEFQPRPFMGMAIYAGMYDKENGLFIPEESGEPYVCAYVWQDADGNLQFEYLAIDIQYENSDPFEIKLPQTLAADIVPMYDISDADRAKITATTDKGYLLLETADAGALSAQQVGVAVKMPAEAGDEAWTCKVNGNDAMMLEAGDYPSITRRSAHVYMLDLASETGTDECELKLEWYDESGALRSFSQLYVAAVNGDPKPWPCYEPDWQPIPKSRLTVETNDLPSGVGYTYDEQDGVIHFVIDPESLPENADYSKAEVKLFVAPPSAEYTHVAYNNSGAENFYGVSPWMAQDQVWTLQDSVSEYQASQEAYENHMFRVYHAHGSDLTVYTVNELTGQFAGGVVAVGWWKEGSDLSGAPDRIEYIAHIHDNCVRVLTSEPLDSEEELPEVITQPMIIIPDRAIHYGENIEFIAKFYPQNGENSLYYKLELLDASGTPVELKGRYNVFLPYPAGITEAEKETLYLEHLNGAHQNVENFSVTEGTLHLAPNGIWFQAEFFSPFVLSWEEAQPTATPVPTATPSPTAIPTPQPTAPSAPPKTGDDASIALWLMLMGASAICLAAMRKRTKA